MKLLISINADKHPSVKLDTEDTDTDEQELETLEEDNESSEDRNFITPGNLRIRYRSEKK
jgi:hypothetical protein